MLPFFYPNCSFVIETMVFIF